MGQFCLNLFLPWVGSSLPVTVVDWLDPEAAEEVLKGIVIAVAPIIRIAFTNTICLMFLPKIKVGCSLHVEYYMVSKGINTKYLSIQVFKYVGIQTFE